MLSKVACPACGTANRIAAGRPPQSAKCGRCGAPLGLDRPVEADDNSLSKHLAATDGPVLLDVWAAWCGPCRMMAPEFEAAAKTLQGQARFLKLDADTNQAASRLGVRGIPTLILFNRGEEIARRSGLAPQAEIVSWLRREAGVPSTAQGATR